MLPFIIAISFASLFFINTLSHSYKAYLLESYIGTQGVLTIHSKSNKYLKELQDKFGDSESSLKKELMRELVISTSQYSLEKKIKIILLEENYLQKKVNYNNQPIAINKVLANILGNLETLSIQNPFTKNKIVIEDVRIVDTGFLSSEPLIFMSNSFIKKLGYQNIVWNSLELDIHLDKINSAKDRAITLSEKYGIDIDFKDILSQNHSSQELFGNIRYMEYIVLFITSLLSFIILTGALNIISKIKEKAISLLRIYGLSTLVISVGLTFLSLLILSISIILAYFIFKLMKIYFIYSIGVSNEFFLSLDSVVVYIVGTILIIFSTLTYIWAYQTFKGKINL